MDQLRGLQASAARLRKLVEPLDAAGIRASAYPSEWTIADMLSHLGSGGSMMLMQLDAFLAGRTVPDDFAQPIWDEWNAKPPEAQVADSLAVDRAMLDRVDLLTDDEVARFLLQLGPLQLDLATFLGLRLNEHALHTWDVEVAGDPAATVAPEAVDLVVDNLSMMVGFVGKPTGRAHDVHIRTTQPARDFTLSLQDEGATLNTCDDAHEPDLELPAEALIRLVYGRLDPDHTPPVRGGADLDELRRAFPGV